MDTKLKGDIAEQAVILEALKLGIAVSVPVGDRLPYDLIFDVSDKLFKIQVKCAWPMKSKKLGVLKSYRVDARTSKTNRRVYKYVKYNDKDFDFVIAFVPEHHIFYVFPSKVFNSYGSGISLHGPNYNGKCKNKIYRDRWDLIKPRPLSED